MPGAEVEPFSLVLDASVAVRWLVIEHGSTEAAALIRRPARWIAPRLMLTEVASALSRKVRARELGPDVATRAVGALLRAIEKGPIRLAADEELVLPALLLAISSEHKLPDCIYLALAEREAAGLATADRRLGTLAESRGVRAILVPSA